MSFLRQLRLHGQWHGDWRDSQESPSVRRDRIIFNDWKTTLSTIESGYDSLMNCSFFLNPSREEMVTLWHSTQTANMLEGANFEGVSSGPDIDNSRNTRAFFITATGLIVSPDHAESGSGTMWDISDSYTLNGQVTG